jgi:hypothetical protein
MVISRNARFIALTWEDLETEKHIVSEETERMLATGIQVFDLLLKKRVVIADVSPLPKYDYGFALSADGSKLAILNDRRVTVCRVAVQ